MSRRASSASTPTRCTYPAHILLRYDLERAMVDGDLAVADLPGAFDAGVKALLGLDVPDDAHGCLQDIHWPGGAFGYFPTYTLGAVAAAQLFEAATAAEPAIRPGLAEGDFAPLLGWLRANVHAKGSSLSTDEIMAGRHGPPARHRQLPGASARTVPRLTAFCPDPSGGSGRPRHAARTGVSG